MADGVEFLALFPHADGEEWIAWTPEGYYVSSSAGDDYVGWHLNRGKDRGADFYRAVQFERILYRPDVVDESFRRRGRPAGGPTRRAPRGSTSHSSPSIAPPRVRVEPVGAPRRDADGGAQARLRISAERTRAADARARGVRERHPGHAARARARSLAARPAHASRAR